MVHGTHSPALSAATGLDPWPELTGVTGEVTSKGQPGHLGSPLGFNLRSSLCPGTRRRGGWMLRVLTLDLAREALFLFFVYSGIRCSPTCEFLVRCMRSRQLSE